MLLEPPTDEQLARFYTEFNMSPESIQRDVEYLKEWITQQPHLPNVTDERRLRNMLFYCKNSVEKVKRVTDLYYTVRGQVPEFFANRDPLTQDVEKIIHTVFFLPLPRHTPDGSRILLFRLMDSNPARYNATQAMKLGFMVGDIRLLEDTCLNNILVFDLTGFTLTHLTLHTIPMVKKFMFVGQKAFPIRQKAVHIIYAPPFVDKILMLFKPFMKAKLAKRMYVHQGLGNLSEYIPRNLLPEDYGGDLPPLKEIHESWKKQLVENRDFFLKEESVFTDESKRPGKPKTTEDLFGMEGSFRSLNID
ncbi:alpha-tocopherol transfer protein-like [Anabrus simplex]|uniref:alpha-tocopherol transfer protein-like n=1 Tax=Anabrus simplex TaxID=316456 RepID=UPI0035A364E9